MNKHAVVPIGMIFFILMASLTVHALATRDKHILRRVKEKCADEQLSVDCDAFALGLTYNEQQELIADKAVGPTVYNFTHR